MVYLPEMSGRRLFVVAESLCDPGVNSCGKHRQRYIAVGNEHVMEGSDVESPALFFFREMTQSLYFQTAFQILRAEGLPGDLMKPKNTWR